MRERHFRVSSFALGFGGEKSFARYRDAVACAVEIGGKTNTACVIWFGEFLVGDTFYTGFDVKRNDGICHVYCFHDTVTWRSAYRRARAAEESAR